MAAILGKKTKDVGNVQKVSVISWELKSQVQVNTKKLVLYSQWDDLPH